MFDKNKKNFLKKVDKSKKGEIDRQIQPLIKLINSKKDYYTTSSCAGRIVLIELTKGKLGSKWLYLTHDKTNFKDIKSTKLTKKDIWFRQEPFILHVMCRDIESAQKLINTARFVGFKRSGIQSTKNKIFIEINSTEIISTIIARNGKLLVDDNYLKILIKEANKKLINSRKKVKKFYSKVKLI